MEQQPQSVSCVNCQQKNYNFRKCPRFDFFIVLLDNINSPHNTLSAFTLTSMGKCTEHLTY